MVSKFWVRFWSFYMTVVCLNVGQHFVLIWHFRWLPSLLLPRIYHIFISSFWSLMDMSNWWLGLLLVLQHPDAYQTIVRSLFCLFKCLFTIYLGKKPKQKTSVRLWAERWTHQSFWERRAVSYYWKYWPQTTEAKKKSMISCIVKPSVLAFLLLNPSCRQTNTYGLSHSIS